MNRNGLTASRLVCTLGFLMSTCLIGGISNDAKASPPAGYTQTWSDEFNGAVGSQANSANWTYDLGYGATNFGNDEQETYTNSSANSHIVTDANATDGLALQIIALNSGGTITSARLKSLGHHTVQYGYLESRIEAFNASGNQGIWPAWWMMGQNMPSVGWPACGEIDIMEQWDGINKNNMSIHGPNMTGSSLTTTGPANCTIHQYHVYGLLWTATTMTYYVDGVQEASFNQSSSPSWPFTQPFFYLLNIAVGGSTSFTGAWNSSTTWPQTMNVDYIREYQTGGSTTGTTTGSTGGVAPSAGVHTLTPGNATGSRLDDNAGTAANGNKVQIWAANGSAAQNWNFASVGTNTWNMAVVGAYCLDGAAATSGSATQIWSCNGSNNQAWITAAQGSGYKFTSKQSGLCLDVRAAGTANGTVVQEYTCNGTTAQTWTLH